MRNRLFLEIKGIHNIIKQIMFSIFKIILSRCNNLYIFVDGKVIKTGDRCDYLLMNETSKTAYLIELKGSDLVKAASQLEATENALRSQLVEYQLQYRIVANKCKTQEIHSSAYRKYQIRWKSRLLQKTGYIEEKI